MLVGQPVSHVWFGDHSALYLELGKLTQRTRRDGAPGNPEGENTVYAAFDWRVEGWQSILGSSSDEQTHRIALAQSLLGATINSARLHGHVPELQLGFSNNLWLATFNLSKGQPDWYVSFRSGQTVHLCIENGVLAVDRRDS